jgi:hypothetical protein
MLNLVFSKYFGVVGIFLGICVLELLSISPIIAQNTENKLSELVSIDVRTIEKLVQSQIVDGNFVGGSIAVMQQGKIIFAKGYGKRSLENNKPVNTERFLTPARFQNNLPPPQFCCWQKKENFRSKTK